MVDHSISWYVMIYRDYIGILSPYNGESNVKENGNHGNYGNTGVNGICHDSVTEVREGDLDPFFTYCLFAQDLHQLETEPPPKKQPEQN